MGHHTITIREERTPFYIYLIGIGVLLLLVGGLFISLGDRPSQPNNMRDGILTLIAGGLFIFWGFKSFQKRRKHRH